MMLVLPTDIPEEPLFRAYKKLLSAVNVLYKIKVHTICTHIKVGGAIMLATRVFQNGNSQAIRIPQELRTDKKDYIINKIGEVYVIYPKDDPWAASRNIVGTFPEDFMSDRNQPPYNDIREEF